MHSPIAVNARYQTRDVTGVERYADEIGKRLGKPLRFIRPKQKLTQIGWHVWEQFILPRLMLKNEVLWSPANTGAWAVSNQVVTLHDASVFDHPEWFRPTFAAWTRLSMKLLAKRARAIITVSEFSKARLCFHLGVAQNKFRVIPNGVGLPFEPKSNNQISKVLQRYKINKPYLFFAGTIEPRKNLTGLISTWTQLGLQDHVLVAAGGHGNIFTKTFDITADRFIQLGRVADEDLASLYAGADAVIQTSLYEGFCLPVLEAMACGAPVIASNTSAFPETVGDAALTVNPRDEKEIADLIKRIIQNHNLAAELRAKGLERAAQFTWDKSARMTRAVLDGA